MKSYPSHELPLEDLLQFASENELTTSIEIRSSFALGRIDVVEGRVTDAHFGGLRAEAAIFAALRSNDIIVRKGRAPRRDAPVTISLATRELLKEAVRRKTDLWREASNTPGEMASERTQSEPSDGRPIPNRRAMARGWSKHLRLGLFGLLVTITTGLVAVSAWQRLASTGVRRQSSALDLGARTALGLVTSPSIRKASASKLLAAQQYAVGSDTTATSRLLVDVLVDEQGHVRGTKFNHSSVLMATAEDVAIAFLMKMEFAPASVEGQAIITWVPVEVSLALHDGSARVTALKVRSSEPAPSVTAPGVEAANMTALLARGL